MKFFTKKQYDALQEAMDKCDFINDCQSIYAIPKSNKTIVEDLYRAIIRNFHLKEKSFSASSAGIEVVVERDFDFDSSEALINVQIKLTQCDENYAWTMNGILSGD
jgi:hypothetical protein